MGRDLIYLYLPNCRLFPNQCDIITVPTTMQWASIEITAFTGLHLGDGEGWLSPSLVIL